MAFKKHRAKENHPETLESYTNQLLEKMSVRNHAIPSLISTYEINVNANVMSFARRNAPRCKAR